MSSEHLRRNSLRVLHIVASTDRRGAETSAVDLARALGDLGMHSSVYALTEGPVGGHDLAVLGPARYDFITLQALRAQAKAHDVVVAHGSSTLLAVAAATVGLPIPFVYRSIGDPRAWITSLRRRATVRAAVRRASSVVVLWRGSAVAWHELVGVPPKRISIIPNGVPVDHFPVPTDAEKAVARGSLGLPETGAVVVCLGALTAEKRIDLAIRAVASLNDVTLVIVGDGAERAPLERVAARHPQLAVRFLGATSQPWRALAAADVLLVPSDTEGQPAVAIEAGLTGLPVVATRVGGLGEIVLDGRTGVLVEPGNPAALASGVTECLRRRDEFGPAARAHCAEYFDLERIAGRWSILLQSVINT